MEGLEQQQNNRENISNILPKTEKTFIPSAQLHIYKFSWENKIILIVVVVVHFN